MSNKYYYKKTDKKNYRIIFRLLGLLIFAGSIFSLVYFFFPLISWQIYFAPVLNSQSFTSPIPKNMIVNSFTIKSLLSQAYANINDVDYTNAENWFPNFNPKTGNVEKIPITSYTISLPALKIDKAIVSTVDHDLSQHLINYSGTSIPPEKGNAVVFGHSTLPQLFKTGDYKTIFANLYKLKVGDQIYVNLDKILYLYKIYNIAVVDPTDNSIFTQNYEDSFLTIVTCTPPGTTWKRLVIKTRLEKI